MFNSIKNWILKLFGISKWHPNWRIVVDMAMKTDEAVMVSFNKDGSVLSAVKIVNIGKEAGE